MNKVEPRMPVTIQVTEGCNLRCGYCYVCNKTGKTIDPKLADTFLAGLKSHRSWFDHPILRDNRGFYIDLFGGEALIEPELCEEICRIARKHFPEWPVATSSNGVWSDKAKEVILRNNISFSVSVDGCREIHDLYRRDASGSGTWDRIMENISWARSYPCLEPHTHYTKWTLGPDSYPYLAGAVQNLIDIGFTEFNFNRYSEGPEDTPAQTAVLCEEWRKILEWALTLPKTEKITGPYNLFYPIGEPWEKGWNKTDDMMCGWGLMPTLGVDGNVYGCARCLPNSSEHGLCLGAYDDWDWERVSGERRAWNHASIGRPPKCKKCPAFRFCHTCYAGMRELSEKPVKNLFGSCWFNRVRMVASAFYHGVSRGVLDKGLHKEMNRLRKQIGNYCKKEAR